MVIKIFSNNFICENDFLDSTLIRDFRNAINSFELFSQHESYISKYSLWCSVIDRLDLCVAYLNKHTEHPKTDEDFLVFMMYATMLIDAIKQLFLEINIETQKSKVETIDNYKYFKSAYINSPIYNREKECPTDEKFFEYLRSMTFAHPFNTNRPKFFVDGEIQYSPYVISNPHSSVHSACVGIQVYSSIKSDIMTVYVPFPNILGYISSRFEKIIYATQWINDEKNKFIENWKMHPFHKN